MNYYDEVLDRIKSLIDEGKLPQALMTIDDELNMPYVPKEFEEKLLNIKDSLYIDTPEKTYSDEELANMLKGSETKQLIAVAYLDKKNLRSYYEMVNDYLSSDGLQNAKALLIDSLIAQEISEEFHMVNGGVEYDFIPRFQLRVSESDGFLSACEYIDDCLMKEPSLVKMAKEIVYKEMMLKMPLSCDEEEGQLYADDAIIYLYKALGDEKGLNKYLTSAKRPLIMRT